MQQWRKAMASLIGLVLGATLACADASFSAATHQSSGALSPITRVVELLQGMSTRIEADGKAEEKAYDDFVCWATSIVSQKQGTNTAAQSRADSLQTTISDLNNNRIELTTERVDLEKEIETFTGDIEIAQQMRQKEAADFDMAKAEMDAAIQALTRAIDVLQTATREHPDGVLVSLKGTLSQTYQTRAKETATLMTAVELGNKVLTRGDSVFLRRLLTGDVPQRAPWKTLNRKATFKMSYKARSFKIQGVLAKLLITFTSNLKQASDKERDAINVFNELMTSKDNEKTAAQTALNQMIKETGKRALSKDQAVAEKTSLSTQIVDDEGYIAQVRTELSEKKSEWKVRQELRVGELAAISKAIAILHSDDARDLIKKSFASQNYFFLQVATSQKATLGAARMAGALEVLQRAAHISGDARIAALATDVPENPYNEVIAAIDSMLTVLNNEESSDLSKKETCESDRTADTREAIKTAREMDELSDESTALKAKSDEINAEIKEKNAQIAENTKELSEITAQRSAEKKEYISAQKDDNDAAALVQTAKQTLEKFYQDNSLMLVQGSRAQQAPFQSQAGAAPPPPPRTWDAPYGGKTQETEGVIAILEMIHDDILKDIAKADEEERGSQALFETTESKLNDRISDLGASVNALIEDASLADQSRTDTISDRTSKKELLAVVMKRIADAEPGCAFITINFSLRSRNRQIEIDGLEKAKAILSGGKFDGLPDPSREMKPGDAALLQGNLRAGRKLSHHSIA